MCTLIDAYFGRTPRSTGGWAPLQWGLRLGRQGAGRGSDPSVGSSGVGRWSKVGLCACPPPFHPPKLSLDIPGGQGDGHQMQSPGVNGGRGNGHFGPPKGPGHQEYPARRGQRAQGQALAMGWKTLSRGLAKRPPGNETQGVGSSVCEKGSSPARCDHTSAGGCSAPAPPCLLPALSLSGGPEHSQPRLRTLSVQCPCPIDSPGRSPLQARSWAHPSPSSFPQHLPRKVLVALFFRWGD